MTIVVTGAHGFVGRAVLAECRQTGREVVGIDSVPGPQDLTTVHQVDIQSSAVSEFIPQSADALIHLAAVSRDADCRERPKEAFEVNVLGTLNLIEAARDRNVRQFVFASSEWVYGDVEGQGAQVEDQPIDVSRISSEYALTKIAGERMLAIAFQRGHLPAVTVLRFAIIYGPRPGNWSAVEALVRAVQTESVVRVGSLRSSRRFIHVSDIARGVVAALGTPGLEVINLAGTRLVTLHDVIQSSAAVLGRHPNVVESNSDAVSVRNPDSAKASRTLSWQPQIDLHQGIEDLVRYFSGGNPHAGPTLQ